MNEIDCTDCSVTSYEWCIKCKEQHRGGDMRSDSEKRMFECLEEITSILNELRSEAKSNKKRTVRKKKEAENYGECCKLARSAYEKLFYVCQEYRKKMGYKPLILKEVWIRTLRKLAREDESVAKRIVIQSMNNGYQGIFELKGKNSGNDEEIFNRLAKQVQCEKSRSRK